MADFRKWFLAFAVVALLSGLAVPVSAQSSGSITCSGSLSGGVPPVVRSEGVADEVGDVVLTCTGGNPAADTASGGFERVNIQVFLNAFVTPRLMSNGLSDALLLINEPGAIGSAPVTICPANTLCNPVGLGGTEANTFQGQLQNIQTSANGTSGYTSLVWTGVPIVPPGSGTLVLRITNVRTDDLSVPASTSQFIPPTIQEFVSISGVHSITLNNAQLAVGVVQPGILLSTTGTGPFLTCVGENVGLLANGEPAEISRVAAIATEGFASSFKVQGGTGQTIPGQNYFTESGFTPGGGIGVANSATRFFIGITNLQSGITLFLPTSVPLYNANTGVVTGSAQLVVCDSSGTNCSAASPDTSSTLAAIFGVRPTPGLPSNAVTALTTFFPSGSVPLTGVSTTGNIFYEVTAEDPFSVESVVIPHVFGFNTGLTVATPTTPVPTLTIGLAPQNTDTLHLNRDPIPRFGPSNVTAANLPTVVACQCNLLFPYVTSRFNFDTGIAVSNTSMDPFGTVPQHGTITFHFYGSTFDTAGAAVALTTAQQTGTSPDIPAGSTYAFSVSSGDMAGGATVGALANYSGYVIATANFQYCHGLAFISGFGRGAFDQGASESYLGLVMDFNALNRTGTPGEVLGQ